MSKRTPAKEAERTAPGGTSATDKASGAPAVSVSDICAAMESIAPTSLAQSWDNVGLLAGDPDAMVHRVLTCIDLTPDVAGEAKSKRIDLIMAYHPPIFKPISLLRADSPGTEAVVFGCIRNGMAIYATHTALDAADGGTNDVIASLCGMKETKPFEYVDRPKTEEFKLVVFVPPDQVESVAEAIFTAGAGHIGDYSRCSYRVSGQGTFFGGDTTSPAIGRRGRMEFVDETRLETVVSSRFLPAVVAAMIKAHPYEEPAFDLYPLKPRPARGIGRIGNLPRRMTLTTLARKLKRSTHARCVQILGPPDRIIGRAAILAGAIGARELKMALDFADDSGCGSEGNVIITGEIRHHDALTILRSGWTAIALGHWASERPALAHLARRLKAMIPGISVEVSTMDRDPFHSAS